MVVLLTLLVASSKERLCCAQECALVQQMWPDCKTIVLSFKRTNSVRNASKGVHQFPSHSTPFRDDFTALPTS